MTERLRRRGTSIELTGSQFLSTIETCRGAVVRGAHLPNGSVLMALVYLLALLLDTVIWGN